MIIAIDGPAASGKGTLGMRIAAHFGLAHLDTGLLYRAVARDVKRGGGSVATGNPKSSRICLRQANSKLVATPLRRATALTLAPSSNVSSTKARLRSGVQRCRAPTEITSRRVTGLGVSLGIRLGVRPTDYPRKTALGGWVRRFHLARIRR